MVHRGTAEHFLTSVGVNSIATTQWPNSSDTKAIGCVRQSFGQMEPFPTNCRQTTLRTFHRIHHYCYLAPNIRPDQRSEQDTIGSSHNHKMPMRQFAENRFGNWKRNPSLASTRPPLKALVTVCICGLLEHHRMALARCRTKSSTPDTTMVMQMMPLLILAN